MCFTSTDVLTDVLTDVSEACSNVSDHLKGLLLTTTGVVVLSPDSLLVRLIETDQWTLLFWRGALVALSLTMFTVLLSGRGAILAFRAVGMTGLYAAALFTGSTLFFISALARTSVANTLVIISAAPLVAAVLSALLLGETVARRTWVAILVGLSAIVLIVSHSIVSHSIGRSTLVGDLFALGTAICLASTFVIVRRARAVSMIPAMAISGLMVAIIVAPWAAPTAINRDDIGLLLLLGGVVLPVSIALITLGPRFLPAPEVSLIMLLETALGPLWVWLALGEQPSWQALVGGGILIVTLAVHSLLARARGGDRPIGRKPS